MDDTAGVRKEYPDPLIDWVKLKNVWARDTDLDYAALGLLTYLTSHKDGFEVTLEKLIADRPDGRHRVMGMIDRLERHGYVQRETMRTRGIVVGTRWHLLDPS